jgi:hypothetical protein
MSDESPNLFDRAVEAVRNDTPADEQVAAARGRVWQKLSGEGSAEISAGAMGAAIRGCADVRALFAAYRARSLPVARELLVQDHLRECPACHAAYTNRRLLPWRQPEAAPRRASTLPRYAVAATLLLVLGGLGWMFRGAFLGAPAGGRAVLDSADGPVYLLAGQEQRRLAPGDELRERQWLRTPRGSQALIHLRDGSRVELREQTELAVSMNRQDLSVHLERGTIIVRAARRTEGHLMVVTEDATAIVTGTVFAVNHGTKGTRISVLEGAVRVESRKGQRELTAGSQFTTNDVQALAIREEIAWSPQLDQYASMLAELSTLDSKLERVRWPDLRYASALLGRVPPGTQIFASLPNYGSALDQAFRLFEERMDASPALKAWWQQSGGGKLALALPDLVAEIKVLSNYLGNEIVLALSEHDRQLRPLFLAEVKRPGLREALPAELAKLGLGQQVRVVSTLDGVAPAPGPLVLVTDTLIAVGTDLEALRAAVAAPAGGAFTGTAFGRRLADCYRDGVGVLLAADMGVIAGRVAAESPMGNADPQAVLRELGADGVRYFVVEQGRQGNITQNRATLSFAGPRTGVASWLAPPAPMGSLDFVTAGASFAAAFVVKQPALVLDDVVRIADAFSPGARPSLKAFESRAGLQLREDLAAPLGNDVTFAIDGPLLPMPSWKVVVEVQDPTRLTATIERLIAEINRQGQKSPGLRLERRESRGRSLFTLGSASVPVVAQWLLSDGYMVIAPTEELLQRAVRARLNGTHLRSAGRFRELVPSDRHANFSALVYHNLGQAGAAVADWLSDGNALRPELRQSLERFTYAARPSLVYVYGEDTEIQVASAGGFFGLTLDHFVGSAGLADLLQHQRGNPR